MNKTTQQHIETLRARRVALLDLFNRPGVSMLQWRENIRRASAVDQEIKRLIRDGK